MTGAVPHSGPGGKRRPASNGRSREEVSAQAEHGRLAAQKLPVRLR